MFIAKNEDLIILANESKEELEKQLMFMNYTSIEETPVEYIMYNGQYLTQEEIDAKEKERIQALTCTKRVFALALQEIGVTYSTLKELIASNEQAQLEWDLSERLLRSNPLIDTMANQLGVTSEQIDEIFKKANEG